MGRLPTCVSDHFQKPGQCKRVPFQLLLRSVTDSRRPFALVPGQIFPRTDPGPYLIAIMISLTCSVNKYQGHRSPEDPDFNKDEI